MPKDTPLPPSLDAPSTANIVTGSLDDTFDAMLLDPPIVSTKDFRNEWGAADTEEALALSSINDARLKHCTVAALALIWGIPMMRPTQLEACNCLLHPNCPNALVVVH